MRLDLHWPPPPTVIMNAHVIDVLDKIVFALLKPRDLFSNAMLEAAADRHPAQQSACMSLAFLPVRPERLDFRVLDMAAHDISQRDDIRSREFIQPIFLAIACVDANGMCPARAVLAERGEQCELQFVTRSGMQNKPERIGFALDLVEIMRRRDSHFHYRG